MRAATDLDCDRGYEWWLMREAKQRNPDIVLSGLSWGAPGWFDGGFWSQDNIDHLVTWLDCAQHHGLDRALVSVPPPLYRQQEDPSVAGAWARPLNEALHAATAPHACGPVRDAGSRAAQAPRMPVRQPPSWSGSKSP